MEILSTLWILALALLHVWIMVLEMFLWTRPIGLRAFGLTPAQALETRTMAANQGLYNGFLAAGLGWGAMLGRTGSDVQVFFLTCVLLAGVFGAATANRRILFIQALPATVGLLLVFLSR